MAGRIFWQIRYPIGEINVDTSLCNQFLDIFLLTHTETPNFDYRGLQSDCVVFRANQRELRRRMIDMKYGGVYRLVFYLKEDKCFHGKIKGISDLITYEGRTKEELYQEFKIVVDMWHKDRLRLDTEILTDLT